MTPDSLLDPANFSTLFAPGDVRNRQVKALRVLLTRLGDQLTEIEFEEWLDDLAFWLQSRRGLPSRRAGEPIPEARLRVLFEAMEQLPEKRAALRASVARLFATSRSVLLFTDVGVPSRHGFFSETTDRVSRALLPDPRIAKDLGQLLPRLFETEAAVLWFEQLSPEFGHRLFALLALPEGEELAPVRRDMAEAAMLLAMGISHHGLANDIRLRSPEVPLVDSPFYKLIEVVRAAANRPAESESTEAAWREDIGACRKTIHDVEASLKDTGVSVDLVYRLDLIRRKLDRLYALLGLIDPPGGEAVEGASLRLLAVLIRGAYRDRSVVDIFRSSTRLLARRVVDAAAHSGEHYVTRSADEFHGLVGSAAGGGVVTAFTAMFKFLLGWVAMAPFWEGFAFSLNYASSFIAMQLLGLTLASKQPSMTAAHLARALGETGTEVEQLASLAREVARTVRSQLAATVGNLGVLVPVVIVLDLLFQVTRGSGLLHEHEAQAVIDMHHPFKSAVVPGAMATGVALWLASLSGGALENWAVFRGLPGAIASHRGLRALVGPDRAKRFSGWLMRNIAGFGGNVSLALMMGLVPTVAVFFGLHLKLHHISIATGQLAFAGMYRGPSGVLEADFLWACVGIVLVGTMNFGVSFTLALWVALRARGGGTLASLKLLRQVWKLFVAEPMLFFWPPSPALFRDPTSATRDPTAAH